MVPTPGITVNGVAITPEQIGAEVQYHPAHDLRQAKYQAMEALVMRALLSQRAVALGLVRHTQPDHFDERVIEDLLTREIAIPEPSREECLRYYQNNQDIFKTSPIFDVAHILYLARPDDAEARSRAYDRALEALKKLRRDPAQFESLARAESSCSSASQGGALGQISKGQTVPAFEAALWSMQPGEISANPVSTEFGFHIIRVNQRAEGRPLPDDMAVSWVADHLKKKSWKRAFHHYIQMLASQAEISGFRFRIDVGPLLQ